MLVLRPPGHHSQRNAANGFCIFNNVAIAAKYAQRKYNLQRSCIDLTACLLPSYYSVFFAPLMTIVLVGSCRILIVDWDVHHGQGIQYIFNEDPRFANCLILHVGSNVVCCFQNIDASGIIQYLYLQVAASIHFST